VTDELGTVPQTSEPMEYVTDLLYGMANPNPNGRTLTDPDAAAKIIAAETRSRLQAVLDRFQGNPAILLSGGVDSIYVAAVAVDLGYRPHAITVVTDDESDEINASAATHALGLPHDVIRLTTLDVVELAREAMERLGTTELWEVTAGIPLLAARRSFDRITNLGAILTGSGADAIFAGGKQLNHPSDSVAGRDELDRLIRTESVKNFRYQRLVPHFYPALLNQYADRLIHVFQTVRWWQTAERFAPTVLFGDYGGRTVDKLALRLACAAQLPNGAKHLAMGPKAPIQRSSGLMSTLAHATRSYTANLHGAGEYSDPMTEDPEIVATRLFLAILNRERLGQEGYLPQRDRG
jgi:asparagine synthase (glutamine-hydrolysing)